MRKITALTAVILCLGLAAGPDGGALALDYPNSPVSIIVPYGAGGGTDLVGRALADAMKGSFPRGIAVENRTGGGGSVGMSYGQNAKPDGNIITMVTVELVTLPHTGTGGDIVHTKFIPIIMVNSAYSAVTVQKSSPYNTLADLIADAKTRPLQVGNSGIGAIWHLAAAGLEQAAGVEFIHVPFDGAAPAITSLLGGHIDAVTTSYAEVISQIEAGELKTLAVLAPRRLASAPQIPTAIELGLDVAIGTWRGFGVPLGTPADIVAWLEKTFTEAAKSPAFVKFMENSKNDIDLLSSQEFAKKLDRDNELFKKLITNLKL
ncbi:MAG: tripartite tricarboxylate transporter substrate binding protein, partial [Planctomycetota bacterium]|nr:tripartite tricarboxylate transporter substrate binding protein [Planctomycetota bacterium]